MTWSRWRESDPRPARYECAALPLSYTGIRIPWGGSTTGPRGGNRTRISAMARRRRDRWTTRGCTDGRNRTRNGWFWKPAPPQADPSVDNDLLRPHPHGVRALLGSRGRLLTHTVAGRDGAEEDGRIRVGVAAVWRKVGESNPQGSSLGGFQDRCRRPSACPSVLVSGGAWRTAPESNRALRVTKPVHRHLCMPSVWRSGPTPRRPPLAPVCAPCPTHP